MDVCDVSGEKVGTVERVGDMLEVKTGPLGLETRLYVPSSEVDGVTEAGVILKHAKHEFYAWTRVGSLALSPPVGLVEMVIVLITSS